MQEKEKEEMICHNIMPMLQFPTMPVTPIEDYKTIKEAADDRRVPYTTYWIRRLIVEKRVQAIRIGPEGKRGQWLVNMPDLLRYIKEK